MNKRVPLILFTGGLDSTYLVYKHLQEGNDVDILYISLLSENRYINGDKRNAELYTIKKILNEFKNMHENGSVAGKIRNQYLDAIYYLSGWDNGLEIPKVATIQPLAWLNGALYFVDEDLHSSVEIAYVLGDSISSSLHRLKKAWKSIYDTIKGTNKRVPLKFPSEFISKKYEAENLPLSLLSMIWSCELPVEIEINDKNTLQYRPCNQCDACKRQNTTFGELAVSVERQDYSDVKDKNIENKQLIKEEEYVVKSFEDNTDFRTVEIIDLNGNIISFKDSNGFYYSATYNEYGKVTSYQDSSGFSKEITYDSNGNLLTHKDSNGYSYIQTYNEKGQLVGFSDSNKVTWSYKYDDNGRSVEYKHFIGDYVGNYWRAKYTNYPISLCSLGNFDLNGCLIINKEDIKTTEPMLKKEKPDLIKKIRSHYNAIYHPDL